MHFTVPSILSAPVILLLLTTLTFGSAASIYELASDTTDLETLKAAVDAAGLASALSGSGNFTVFAPTNDAFNKIDSATITKLLEPEWSHHLEDILLYHVLPTEVRSSDLADGSFETLNGESILINSTALTINDSSKIVGDSFDIEADNGVIHMIDTVLLPSSVTSNIVEIASQNSDLSTLVDLVVAADLVGALSAIGPFTVFAPNDSAFAALPTDVTESLTNPENKAMLSDVLTYHVVSGIYNIGNFPSSLETLNGNEIQFSGNDEVTSVNDAEIISTVYANNGVIHVVDKVLEYDQDTSGSSMGMHLMGVALTIASASILLL